MKKVVIAGGSGFIGKALVAAFLEAGFETVVLSRFGKGNSIRWDGKSLGPWTQEFENAEAVINLSGEPAILRWTPENRKRILDSRVDSTRAFAAAVSSCRRPPKVWINASAVGYYGDTGDREVDESAAPGEGFLAEVCKAWEAAVDDMEHPNTRKIKVRIGFPLGLGGGLNPLVNLTKGFLGGPAGSGKQFVPWIHVDDLAALFLWCVENEKAPDVVNGVGPAPVRNADLMAALRKKLRRPWSPPAPTFLMKLVGALIGLQVEPLLESSRVIPRAALDGGFSFRFTELSTALGDLLQPGAKRTR